MTSFAFLLFHFAPLFALNSESRPSYSLDVSMSIAFYEKIDFFKASRKKSDDLSLVHSLPIVIT